jgi:hypothetical protein
MIWDKNWPDAVYCEWWVGRTFVCPDCNLPITLEKSDREGDDICWDEDGSSGTVEFQCPRCPYTTIKGRKDPIARRMEGYPQE